MLNLASTTFCKSFTEFFTIITHSFFGHILLVTICFSSHVVYGVLVYKYISQFIVRSQDPSEDMKYARDSIIIKKFLQYTQTPRSALSKTRRFVAESYLRKQYHGLQIIQAVDVTGLYSFIL